MKTEFTPEQLQQPALAEANKILRSCVHCGFCTATCPTFLIRGDELDSPRGRIYLLKDMLESGRPADDRTVTHIDRCLGCLSCMTTCPSGVHYAHLLEIGKAHIEATYRRPWRDRALRWMLAKIVPHAGRFRLAMLGAKLVRPFRRLMPDARLRAMLDMAPASLPPPSPNDRAQVFAPHGEKRARVALMIGCAQRALNTDINDATIRLLRRAGCEVVIPQNFGCCGAMTLHMGREGEGRASARAAIASLIAADRHEALDAVIVNTSGCGTTIKDYGHLFAGDSIEPDAIRIAALARDVTEFLTAHGLPQTTPHPARVAYHSACSLQHGQQVKTAPKTLLQQAGFEVVEPADPHLCCGSAGTYNMLQPELSGELKRRKLATLQATAPQIIAAGNIGCMVQIGSGTATPVVHTVELLDWATGGPKPAALPA
ncbi:glycolate oxidase subunit GlcF [Paracoccus aerodenitrificans]|uniref:glycolate oxidase subunit GlcF n=1 Tax=Paracoccus aerodenitrificans TaxID=3017781 RepID=UPI0022F06612|nr:glycolate oxidase subunit GlcF [Paracoccus aerodenitrificans]WBU62884.1 glycolate oxidase subunit GlcF [Paracoccus aerodenitrificans]